MNLNATILGQAIAFAFFVVFCMKYVWPSVIAAIEKRQKDIADGLSYAERAKKELDLAQVNANDNLNSAKAQAQAIIELAGKRKAQILDEAKAEAERERQKIVAQAQAEIDTACKRAREELRKQIAMLAIAGAEKIIERSVDEELSRDIVDKLVAQL